MGMQTSRRTLHRHGAKRTLGAQSHGEDTYLAKAGFLLRATRLCGEYIRE